jgi:hypothetical protein
LDPGGIRIAANTGYGGFTAYDNLTVAFDGTQFVVVWSDARADAADLYAARITVDGRDLDPGGTPLVARAGAQIGPALASSGSQLLLTWTDSSNPANGNVQGSTWVQRVDSTSLATVGTAVNAGAGLSSTSSSRAVWSGANWVVGFFVSPDASSLNVALDIVRVDANGALLDTAPREVSSVVSIDFGSGFGLASDGQVTVVAYSEDPTGTDSHVRAARFGSDGSPLTPSPVELAHPGPAPARVLGVGLAGGTFEVSWSNPDTSGSTADGGVIAIAAATTVQRLNSDGSLPTLSSFSLSSSNDVYDVTTGSQSLLAVRSQLVLNFLGGAGSSVLTFQRFSSSGTALDAAPVTLNVASNAELTPRAAWNGKRYYACWLDRRGGSDRARAYGTVVRSDGTVPSSTATALASAGTSQAQLFLAGGASTFVALWKENPSGSTGQTLATRIDDTGSVLDPTGIVIARDVREGGISNDVTTTATSLTFDGKQFLGGDGVAFQDGSSQGTFSIALDGGVASTQLPWAPNGNSSWASPNVQVASTGAGSLVEWDWSWTGSSFDFTTLEAKASTPTVQPSFDSRSGHYATVDSIASDGSSYLLVFTDSSNSSPPSPEELWVWRFDASGAPATAMPTRVATVSTSFSTAQLVFDGSDYLLVWDPRDGTGQSDVVGVRLTRDGSPMTTSPFVIAGTSWNETQPSVASDGAGHALVTYERFDPSSTFGSMRARARLVDLTSQPVLDGSTSQPVPDGSTDSSGETGGAPADGPAEPQDAMREVSDAGLPRGEARVSVSGGGSCSAAPAGGARAGWGACVAALVLRRRRGRRRRPNWQSP